MHLNPVTLKYLCVLLIVMSSGSVRADSAQRRQTQDRSSAQRDGMQRQSQPRRTETQNGRVRRSVNRGTVREQIARQRRRQQSVPPAGWVRVATDYNNDGRFDSVEIMYYQDLVRAQQVSRQRSMNQRGTASAGRVNRNRSARRRQETVSGKIKQLRHEQLAGTEQACLIARVSTDDNRIAKVCLGPQSQLSELNLRQGTTVEVTGLRGHINDKTILFAQRITVDDQQVTVQMPSGRNLKRVRGHIVNTRTANFRGRDTTYIVASVDLVNGKKMTVNLGPRRRIRELNLQAGDRVSMLVRPGRINGSPALIAEQIRAKSQTITIPRSQNAQNTNRQSRQTTDRRSDQP